jgi:hypothetical protein
MKKTLFILLSVFVLLSCSSDNDESAQVKTPLLGTVSLYFKDKKIEYKEISLSRFTYVNEDSLGNKVKVSGIKYCLYTDETHSIANALFLNVIPNVGLASIDFVYFHSGANWGKEYSSGYKHLNNDQVNISSSYFENEMSLKGMFKGKLYWESNDFLEIDSCKFDLRKSDFYARGK